MIHNETQNEPNQIITVIESFKKSITHTWENEGSLLLSSSKVYLNKDEKHILASLLILKSPSLFERKTLWLMASGAKREIINNPGYYNSLINSFPDTIDNPALKAIEMDINRTFGSESFFRLEETKKKLRNVLIAISRRLNSIGYCQGFNFMEETFWIFIQIVEHYLQLNYYTDLTALMADCVIMIRLLTNIFPSMIDQMVKKNHDISLSNFLFKSLLCLFAENMNETICFLIWDVLFLKGDTTIFKGIICLLKAFESKIINSKSLSDISNIFSKDIPQYSEKEAMIYYLLLKRYDFSKESIENNRQLMFPTVRARYLKISSSLSSNKNKILLEKTTKELSKCNQNAPHCINEPTNNYHTVFVIRQAENHIIIRKNYFFTECQSYPFDSHDTKDYYSTLLIERTHHSCHINKSQEESNSINCLDSINDGSNDIHSLLKQLNDNNEE